MKICNLGEVKAIAFDIDGTLYRESNFFIRIIPHFILHWYFFLQYGLARKDLRKMPPSDDFFKLQAEVMAKRLHCTPEKAQNKLDKIVYEGLKKYYKNVKPCENVTDLIEKLNNAGFKIAILSDFPPEQKGEIWGIKQKCDVVLGTEETGALKPSDIPFRVLAERLNVPLEEVFYIGNNHKYDIEGPKKLGMKAGWFSTKRKCRRNKKSEIADFSFWHYKQLEEYIFNK